MEQSQSPARRANAAAIYIRTVLFVLLAGIVGPAFIVISFFVNEPWLLPVGIGVTALDLLIGVLLARGSVRNRRRVERLERVGVRGTAEVLSASETNVTINDRPVVAVRLRVSGTGVQPFEVDKRVTVGVLQMPVLHGGRLVVLIDPETKDFEIDWPASASMAGIGLPGVAHTVHLPDGSVHPVGDPAQLNTVVEILRRNGLPTDGQIDLHQHPTVRAEVLRTLGFDPSQTGATSVGSAAADAAVRAPKRTAVERLRDLDQLHESGAISSEEHAAARRRVLDEI